MDTNERRYHIEGTIYIPSKIPHKMNQASSSYRWYCRVCQTENFSGVRVQDDFWWPLGDYLSSTTRFIIRYSILFVCSLIDHICIALYCTM